MKPNYVAQKSLVKAFSPLCVLFFWLVIPTFIIIFRILAIKCESFEFYDDHVIHKWGVLKKHEDLMPFFHVNGVSFSQSLFGSMFNYGDLVVDATGKWDLNLTGIKNPREVKAFLETRAAKEADFKNIIHE